MQPSRRSVLVAAALAALAACTGRKAPRPVVVDPDTALVDAAVSREQALLTAYDATLAAHPQLAALLVPLRQEHLVHLERLRPPAAGTPTPSASATAVPAGPKDRRAALAALAGLERQAAAAHGAAAVSASRRVAPLLASLSASEASHVVVL